MEQVRENDMSSCLRSIGLPKYPSPYYNGEEYKPYNLANEWDGMDCRIDVPNWKDVSALASNHRPRLRSTGGRGGAGLKFTALMCSIHVGRLIGGSPATRYGLSQAGHPRERGDILNLKGAGEGACRRVLDQVGVDGMVLDKVAEHEGVLCLHLY